MWLIPIGLAYAVVYYLLFRFAIRRFNLATPGRERGEPVADSAPGEPDRGEPAGSVEEPREQVEGAAGEEAEVPERR